MPDRALSERTSRMLAGLASVPDVPVWVIPVLAGATSVMLLLRRILPATIVWTVVVTLLTGALSLPLLNRLPHAGGTVQTVASASAFMALLWSGCGAIATWIRHRKGVPSNAGRPFIAVAHVVALMLGVVAAFALVRKLERAHALTPAEISQAVTTASGYSSAHSQMAESVVQSDPEMLAAADDPRS